MQSPTSTDAWSPAEIAGRVESVGVAKAGLNVVSLLTLSVLAGAFISLGAVFFSGVLFIGLSVSGLRTALVEAIPRPLRRATAGGIGLFLAFIGLQNAGIIFKHPVTMVTLGDLTAPAPLLFLVGLLITGALYARKVASAILVGIALISTAALEPDGVTLASIQSRSHIPLLLME